MKKYLLLSLLFIAALATANAGCGGCEGNHEHAKEEKAECAKECEKECSTKKEECCGTEGSCCAEEESAPESE